MKSAQGYLFSDMDYENFRQRFRADLAEYWSPFSGFDYQKFSKRFSRVDCADPLIEALMAIQPTYPIFHSLWKAWYNTSWKEGATASYYVKSFRAGKMVLEAVVGIIYRKPFAFHLGDNGWIVTHLPTGYAVLSNVTITEAKNFIERISESDLHYMADRYEISDLAPRLNKYLSVDNAAEMV